MGRYYELINRCCNIIFGIWLGVLTAFAIASIAALDITFSTIFTTLSIVVFVLYKLIIIYFAREKFYL